MKRKSDPTIALEAATDQDRPLNGATRPLKEMLVRAGATRGLVEEIDPVQSDDASEQTADESDVSSETDADTIDSEEPELGEEDSGDASEPVVRRREQRGA